jgi:hypothetical protein
VARQKHGSEQRLEAPFSPNRLTDGHVIWQSWPLSAKFRAMEKMSYNVSAHYASETFIKNRPDGFLKHIVGKLSGRKRP